MFNTVKLIIPIIVCMQYFNLHKKYIITKLKDTEYPIVFLAKSPPISKKLFKKETTTAK